MTKSRSLVTMIALLVIPTTRAAAPLNQAQTQGNAPAKNVVPQQSAQDPAAFWDAVFSKKDTRYVRETNAFLAYVTDRIVAEKLCPGKEALDLAMGEGRNAFFLAQKGFSVTGLDISKVAIEHAQATAKEKGLVIETIQADLFEYDYGTERFDLIALFYFNPALRVLDKLRAALKPGGVIIIEGQGKEHQGSGPPAWSRFAPNQLLKALDDWRVLEYQDGVYPCDWNDGKPTHVVRILARKPGAAPDKTGK
jgi:SAM-dependent methyltransferase